MSASCQSRLPGSKYVLCSQQRCSFLDYGFFSSLVEILILVDGSGGCPDFAESAQFHKVLQGQELLGYRTHDNAAVATSQPCEARNMQYIDERSCSNDVSNNIRGFPRLGVRTPLGNRGFSYHCSGFGESQRFQKVLQGQEVFRPYRGTLVDACLRNDRFHQQDGSHVSSLVNKWHTQLHGCAFRGPPAPAPVLPSQSSSPPSVLMFQRGNSKMSQFEFGYGPLDKNEDDRAAMFGHAGGIEGTEQPLMLQTRHISGEMRNSHTTVENFHPVVAIGKDGPDNGKVNTTSCKIFGISLTEKVPASKGKDSGDASYLSLKQQVPKSLGNSCATVSSAWPLTLMSF